MRFARIISASIVAVLATAPIDAYAQMGAALPGKYRFNAGWLLNTTNTSVRLDSPRLGTGTTIDFEDDLGFDNRANSVFLGFNWQFAAKHRLDLTYNDVDRTSIKTIDRELHWGDQVYPVNAKIGGNFGTQFITLSYRYALWRRTGFEVGPSLGIPVVSVTVGAGVEGASGQVQKESKDITVPAPIPGLYFSARLHPQFYLQGNAQYMKINIFSISADMTDYRLQAVWLPTKHFGGGLALSGNNFKIGGTDESKLYGSIKYGVVGPSLFLTFTP